MQVSREWQDLMGRRETREMLETRDLLVLMVLMVYKGHLDPKGLLVITVLMASQAFRASRVGSTSLSLATSDCHSVVTVTLISVISLL